MDKVTAIRACAKRLRLSCLMTNVTEVLMQAQKESPSYDDLLLTVLEAEVKSREEKQLLLAVSTAVAAPGPDGCDCRVKSLPAQSRYFYPGNLSKRYHA